MADHNQQYLIELDGNKNINALFRVRSLFSQLVKQNNVDLGCLLYMEELSVRCRQ